MEPLLHTYFIGLKVTFLYPDVHLQYLVASIRPNDGREPLAGPACAGGQWRRNLRISCEGWRAKVKCNEKQAHTKSSAGVCSLSSKAASSLARDLERQMREKGKLQRVNEKDLSEEAGLESSTSPRPDSSRWRWSADPESK